MADVKEQERVFDETPGLALEVNGGFTIPIEKDFYIFERRHLGYHISYGKTDVHIGRCEGARASF